MLLVLTACQSAAIKLSASIPPDIGKVIQVEWGSYRDISVTDLLGLMEIKNFLLINVHIPFEGNLPNTDASIPYDTIGQNLDKLPDDKAAIIVLYCRSDRMSTIAAAELVKLGYTNVWNLDGGMAAWEQAGQPIER